MKATSCLEIFSRLIFSAATFGMILRHKQSESHWWENRPRPPSACLALSVPDAAQLGAVVVAIDDVVQDLQHQLPQLAVLHQGDGEERIQEERGQRRRHGLGLEAGGHLRGDGV